MKYKNTKTGAVATLLEEDSKFKTVLLELEDGTTKSYSLSTLKRWWKEVEEAPAKAVEKPKQDKPKEVKPRQKKEYNKTTSPEVLDILKYIEQEAKKLGGEYYIRDKQSSLYNYKFRGTKVRFTATKGKNKVYLNAKSTLINPELLTKMEEVNGFHNRRYIVTKLDDESKKFIAEFLKSVASR